MLLRSQLTPFWPVRLLALGLIAAVLAHEPIADQNPSDSSPDSAARDDVDTLEDTPAGGSRSVWGVLVNGSVEWIVPLFGARTCSEIDGFLCGIGVIIRREYMLASNRAMLRISTSLNNSGNPYGPPGVFWFKPPREIDISKPNEKFWQYGPRHNHIKTIAHGIGIWKVSIRDSVERAKSVPFAPREIAPLETQKGSVLSPCRVFSYGNWTEGAKGLNKPTRYLNAIYVEAESCDKNLCKMQPSMNKDEIPKTGALCGYYSELGAPILCGQGKDRRVKYIVTELDQASFEICNPTFTALEIAEYTGGIKYDVDAWIGTGRTFADPPFLLQNTFMRPG